MALQTRIPARDEAAEYYFRYIGCPRAMSFHLSGPRIHE
jgi:hypothetical protein